MSASPGGMWGQLPASNRRWIVVNALIVTAAVNLILNAALASLSVSDFDSVPIWGAPFAKEPSLFGSALGSLFLLPLITCLIVTGLIRRDVRLDSLRPLPDLRSAHRWLTVLPATRFRRGVALGALVLLALAPLLALVLFLLDPAALSQGQFVVCQTTLTVVLGAIVTPAIAVAAMADPAE
ncbi:MAG TPA: hypothetical protein VFT10_10060 [Solirubrobacterales bacterium]|nr:hypothetical protein [Solirubrobacterales bacterium]